MEILEVEKENKRRGADERCSPKARKKGNAVSAEALRSAANHCVAENGWESGSFAVAGIAQVIAKE
jgi:hypothetical protein